MERMRVTMVDVNDVQFYVFVKAESPEAAINMAEFENQYCSTVEVSQLDQDGEWCTTYVPGQEENEEEWDDDYDDGDHMTDVEADADTLRNCGWGTDEDYGYYGEDY